MPGRDAARAARYGRAVEASTRERLPSAHAALRVGLVLFVVAWIFGPYALRSAVPIWLPFLLALGLELQFFFGPRRSTGASSTRDRLPQAIDRERYGYAEGADDLLLVRRGGEELWIPYAGESAEEVDTLVEEAQRRAEEEADAPPRTPVQAPARPTRQLLVGLVVLAALAAAAWVVDSHRGWSGVDDATRARATARFSAEASRIAGHPVTIRCDDAGTHVGAVQHADGVAIVGGRLAYLTPERCYDLYRLAEKDQVSFSQTGRAVAVLAHESWHLRGERDEGTTECYALQSGVELGRRLGLSEGTARQMMRQQLVENRLRTAATQEYVLSPECRDGGDLDLRPGVSDFP